MTQPLKMKANTAGDGFYDNLDVEFLIHELKDPLSVIETAVRLLLEKQNKYGSLTDRQAKTLKRALKSSKKARGLVGALLEVGRSGAGCFDCRWFDAVTVLNDVILEALEETDINLWETLQGVESEADRTALYARNGIDLAFSANSGDLQLCQDEVKFRQIMGNLIKNALQHRSRHLRIGMACRDERLMIEVIDDGPGIGRDHRELIFERYTRVGKTAAVSRPGHGLGLAGARILARHLGGDITVRNGCDSGAIFCLLLPMALDFDSPLLHGKDNPT